MPDLAQWFLCFRNIRHRRLNISLRWEGHDQYFWTELDTPCSQAKPCQEKNDGMENQSCSPIVTRQATVDRSPAKGNFIETQSWLYWPKTLVAIGRSKVFDLFFGKSNRDGLLERFSIYDWHLKQIFEQKVFECPNADYWPVTCISLCVPRIHYSIQPPWNSH